MDRSIAGRPGFGRPTRRRTQPRRPPGRPAAKARRSPWERRITLGPLGPPLESLAGAIARGASPIWARRRLRIGIIATLCALPLLFGGWSWLRGSSLVSVRHVQLSGAHGPEARAIDSALTLAARRMSTLEVRRGPLMAAVAGYPRVDGLQLSTHFPHGLSIRVIERVPVAALSAGSTKTAVAADGVVLGPASLSSALPTLAAGFAPAPGARVNDGSLRAALAVLGAAPAPLAKLMLRAYPGPKGLTIALRGGLLAYFGDASRAHAKWASLARVLADKSSAGASYIDVRVPERPAAGFASGVLPEQDGAGGSESGTGTSNSETTAALAEGLAKAVGGGSSASPATTQPEAGATAQPEAGESPSSSKATAPAGGESAEAPSTASPVEGG